MKSKIVITAFLLSFAAQAQVGVSTTDPKTMLDIGIGALTHRQVDVTVSANTATLSTETSLVNITGTATATVTLTAYTPAVDGHRLVVSNSTTGGYSVLFAGTQVPTSQAQEFIYTTGAWKAITSPVNWKTPGNTGTIVPTNFIGTTDFIDLRIRTNNIDAMTVKTTGLVGIGTTSPLGLLSNTSTTAATDASGRGAQAFTSFNWATSGNAYGAIINNSDASGTGSGLLLKSNSTSTSSYPLKVMVGSTEALTIDGARNVGLGTTSPTSAKLHVYSTSNPMKLEGLQVSQTIGDRLLVTSTTGVVKTSIDAASYFVGYMTADATIPAVSGTITKTIVDTEVIDVGNEYNATTGIFTPAAAGIYQWEMVTTSIYPTVSATAYGGSTERVVMGFTNNATGQWILRFSVEGTNDPRTYFATGVVTLAAGGSYYFGQSSAGGNGGTVIANPSTLSGSGFGTYFSIKRLK